MRPGELTLSVKFSTHAVNDAEHASPEPWRSTSDGNVMAATGRVAEVIRRADRAYIAGARTALPALARSHLRLVRLIAEAARDGDDSAAAKQLKEISVVAAGMLQDGSMPDVMPAMEPMR